MFIEKDRFLIYPWNISSTDAWTLEGLRGLRDESAQEIAEIIKSDDGDMEVTYVTAMAEYLSHGHQRKAAEVTRALVAIEPAVEPLIKSRFKPDLVRHLLRTSLDLLPANPTEIRAGVIEYVQ